MIHIDEVINNGGHLIHSSLQFDRIVLVHQLIGKLVQCPGHNTHREKSFTTTIGCITSQSSQNHVIIWQNKTS